LGTGNVGDTIASKLVSLGHEVRMGSRQRGNENAVAWATRVGTRASEGNFADAAAFGEILWNCTSGGGSLAALQAAGAENLKGKIVIDIANPLDFSKGMPPRLSIVNDDSLGEQLQRAFPEAKVVKTLNTINCKVMVQPSLVPGASSVFMSGNHADAKAKVHEILTSWFGWSDVLDLGDITSARGTEAYLLLWLRLWGALKTGDVNVHVVR
jgi:predicted dinucleotide-binding enzyme